MSASNPLDDLDAWWLALTQTTTAQVGESSNASAALHEGLWIRTLFMRLDAHPQQTQTPSEAEWRRDATDAQWLRMRERLWAHGLLGADEAQASSHGASASGPPSSSGWVNAGGLRGGTSGAARAFAHLQQKSKWIAWVLALSVLAGWIWQGIQHNVTAPMTELPIQLRGDESWQRLTVADPLAQAREIEALFKAAGLTTYMQNAEQGLLIQAQVPPGQTELNDQLQKMGVQIPAHGRVHLWLPSSKR